MKRSRAAGACIVVQQALKANPRAALGSAAWPSARTTRAAGVLLFVAGVALIRR